MEEPNRMRGSLLIITVLLGLVATRLEAQTPEGGTATRAELEMRGELHRAPSGDPDADQGYGFVHGRLRYGMDVAWRSLTVAGTFQAAGALGLPGNGSFGAGPAYYLANDGQTRPGALSLLELNLALDTEHVDATLGRMAYASAGESRTGVTYLDVIKRNRLQERLVGNWEWTNMGRRFDGVKVGVSAAPGRLDAFGLAPTSGGINYLDGHAMLDDVYMVGFSATGHYDALVPRSEFQLFTVFNYDNRPVVRDLAGNPIEVLTLGGHILLGGDGYDALFWFAAQSGDWGDRSQSAVAYFVEAGKRLDGFLGGPVIRVGYASASGQSPDDIDHGTFYNLFPTNHKYYGSLDYNAFSNLRDLHVEGLWRVSSRGVLRLAGHAFWLNETGDGWYGGSGAFSDDAFGYVTRRPADGDFVSTRLGQEIDADLTFGFLRNHRFSLGGGAFFGDRAAGQVLTEDRLGLFGYARLQFRN